MMKLAVYLAVVSLVYAVLEARAPDLAATLLVAFVALLLVPVVWNDYPRWRNSRRG